MVEIRTQRLLLRPAVPADMTPTHAILSNPRATTYWSTPPHDSLDRSREWLQGMIDIPPLEGEDFIVEHQGRVIGKAGLYRFPEIGWRIQAGPRYIVEARLRTALDWRLG